MSHMSTGLGSFHPGRSQDSLLEAPRTAPRVLTGGEEETTSGVAEGLAWPQGGGTSVLQASGLPLPVIMTPTSPETRICSQVRTRRRREARHPALGVRLQGSGKVDCPVGNKEQAGMRISTDDRVSVITCGSAVTTCAPTPTSLQETQKLGQREVVERDQTAPGGRGAAIPSRSDPGKLPLHPGLSFPKPGVHIGSFSWTFRHPRSPWASPRAEGGQLATGRGGTGRRLIKGSEGLGGGRKQENALEGAWRASEDQAPAGLVLAARRGGAWARAGQQRAPGRGPAKPNLRAKSPATRTVPPPLRGHSWVAAVCF